MHCNYIKFKNDQIMPYVEMNLHRFFSFFFSVEDRANMS